MTVIYIPVSVKWISSFDFKFDVACKFREAELGNNMFFISFLWNSAWWNFGDRFHTSWNLICFSQSRFDIIRKSSMFDEMENTTWHTISQEGPLDNLHSIQKECIFRSISSFMLFHNVLRFNSIFASEFRFFADLWFKLLTRQMKLN